VFKVLSSRRIYDGKIVNLRVDEVERDGGRRSTVEVVEHGGGVAIIASPSPQQVVLVRQYRHATGHAVWEVPAGKIDPGEDPATSAARELVEETGYRCERMHKLWTFFTSPGFCNELLHLYVAQGLSEGAARPEADEVIEVKLFDIGAAWAMVQRDELPDAKTQIALAFMVLGANGL
jgi:ADP-ribose pyrophosphatase